MKDKLKRWAGKITGFGAEVRAEMVKSSWPTRSELAESTLVVVFTVVLLSLFVGLSDLVIGQVVRKLL